MDKPSPPWTPPLRLHDKSALDVLDAEGELILQLWSVGSNDALPEVIRICNCHDAVVEALKAADLFIANGVETGHIRMPARSTPDPAHDVPGLIRAALALAGGGR